MLFLGRRIGWLGLALVMAGAPAHATEANEFAGLSVAGLEIGVSPEETARLLFEAGWVGVAAEGAFTRGEETLQVAFDRDGLVRAVRQRRLPGGGAEAVASCVSLLEADEVMVAADSVACTRAEASALSGAAASIEFKAISGPEGWKATETLALARGVLTVEGL